MTRYFYDDALKAAWMAKHFGMRFNAFYSDAFPNVEVLFDHSGGYFHSGLLEIADDPYFEPTDEICISADKYFIHPNSLSIPEPQEKDKGEDHVGNAVEYIGGSWRAIDGSVYVVHPVRIEKRSGKVFFSPKCE